MISPRFITALLLLLSLVSPLAAQEPPKAEDEEPKIDIEALLAQQHKAIEEYVAAMEELAAWADKNDIFACRNRVYEDLILYRPEHRVARQTLRFHKKRDGTWERRGGRPPRDHEEDLIPEFEARFSPLGEKLHAALIAALKASEGAGVKERETLTVEILKGFPDDATARDVRGEAKRDGKWLLKETVAAIARRDELATAAQEAIEAVAEPKPVDLDDIEKNLGVDMVGAWKGVWWRASGSTDEDEVLGTLTVMDASHPFFDYTFGLKTAAPHGCGFYLLSGKDEAKTVLTNHPLIPESKRNFYLGLRAGWIPGKRVFFHWSDSATVRLDGSVRMALGIMILRNFSVNTNRGWVWEGLGLYMDYHLTGGHRTIFVTPEMKTTTKRRTPFDIETRMKKPGADWVQLAFDLVEANAEPEIQPMTKRKVNELDPEDLVYGYALVAYLVEGHPTRATEFFSKHGVDQPIEETIESVFDWPLDYFIERYHRWLHEIN
ncbi:MAG: hypothetical protein ABFS86_06410 [Planctomycetota bacterium]